MTVPAILHSTNGTTWSSATSPFDNLGEVAGIAYGAGVWVAVGNYEGTPVIASSSNGITWTQRTSTLASGGTYVGVAYGDGVFVTLAANTAVVYTETSTNGTTWTGWTAPSFASQTYTPSGIVYGGSGFLITSFYTPYASTGFALITSTNGTSWSIAEFTASQYCGVTGLSWAGDKYVLAATGGGTTVFATSANASSWTTYSTPFVASFYPSTTGGKSGIYIISGYDSSTNSNVIAKSTDGATWGYETISGVPSGATANIAGYDGANFYLVGGEINVASSMLSSSDASTWSAITLPSDAPAFLAFAYESGVYVAGGYANQSLYPPGVPNSMACK